MRSLLHSYRFWISLLILALRGAAATGYLEIVSILDGQTATACMLKIHSIVESAEVRESLSFNFLLMPDADLTVNQWNTAFEQCFPNIRYNTKVWHRPAKLIELSGNTFDKDVIYARFYLPDIFPRLKRFVYLDNDIIVTSDLYSLYSHKLVQTELIPGSEEVKTAPVVNPRAMARLVDRPQPPINHNAHHQHAASATVAFVYEHHPGYRDYIHGHFNMSHAFVRNVVEARGSDAFLNGGVFVVDALRWRQKHLTTQIEKFLVRNQEEHMYDSEAVGDQGPFLLMFLNDTAYLPPRYNMRRLPKRTVNILNEGITGTCFESSRTNCCCLKCPLLRVFTPAPFNPTLKWFVAAFFLVVFVGIVHFAGTTHSDAGYLCHEPTKYPMYLTGAVPLYLSIAHSFHKKCPASPFTPPVNACENAVPLVQQELTRLGASVKYNPGLGHFVWPPQRKKK